MKYRCTNQGVTYNNRCCVFSDGGDVCKVLSTDNRCAHAERKPDKENLSKLQTWLKERK